VFTHAPGATKRKRAAARCMLLLDDRSLLVTVQQGDLRRVRFLLEVRKENSNVTNKYGMTPLHFAVINKDIEMTEMLTQFGADPFAVNNNHQSPFTLVQSSGDDRVSLALEKALGEGKRKAKERKRAFHKRKTELEALTRKEDLLARELRIYTKGTAAAGAVFQSFRRTDLGGHPHKQGEAAYARPGSATRTGGAGAGGSRAQAAATGGRTVAVGNSGKHGAVAAALGVPPPQRATGGGPDAALLVQPAGRYAVSGEARSAMKWHPAIDKSKETLATSWNRHALSFFHKQMKEEALKDYKRRVHVASTVGSSDNKVSVAAGAGATTRASLRDSQKFSLFEANAHLAGAHGEAGFGAGRKRAGEGKSTGTEDTSLRTAGGAAMEEFRRRSGDPAKLTKDIVHHEHSIPSADDSKFEDWMRLRFGT
jgi:hypothetical protein